VDEVLAFEASALKGTGEVEAQLISQGDRIKGKAVHPSVRRDGEPSREPLAVDDLSVEANAGEPLVGSALVL